MGACRLDQNTGRWSGKQILGTKNAAALTGARSCEDKASSADGGEPPSRARAGPSWAATGRGVGIQYHQGRPEELGRQLRKFGGGGGWMTGSTIPVLNSCTGARPTRARLYWGGAHPGDNLYTSSVLRSTRTTPVNGIQEIRTTTGTTIPARRGLVLTAKAKAAVHQNKAGSCRVHRTNGKIENVCR